MSRQSVEAHEEETQISICSGRLMKLLCGPCLDYGKRSARQSGRSAGIRAFEPQEDYLLIHRLVDAGNKTELKNFLEGEGGRAIEFRDPAGLTPLNRACGRGQLEVVELLIEKGADLRAKVGGREATSLHIAAQYGRASVVSRLLQSLDCIDILMPDHDGDTPLHEAALQGNVEVLQAFVTHLYNNASPHVSLDLPNRKSLTLLHYAAGKGNLDVVRFLLQNGANRDACDEMGATPFHFAARCGSKSAMEILIENHDDNDDFINIRSRTGMTALHYAAWNGRSEEVKWLISRKACVDATDLAKNTPLHWAARNGSPEVIEALVRAGANVFAANAFKEMPMGLAIESDTSPTNSVITAICTSIEKADIGELNVMAIDRNGAMLLHYAAGYATSKVIEWLIHRMRDYIIASEKDKKQNLDILLNSEDKLGRNPFHWAAMKGNRNPGVVQVLAQNKVRFLKKDREHQTPLFLSLIHAHPSFAKEFLAALRLPDDEGFEALQEFRSKRWLVDDIERWASVIRRTIKEENKKLIPPTPTDQCIDDMTPFYIALHIRQIEIAKLIQHHRIEDAVNKKSSLTGRAALHWATMLRQVRKDCITICNRDEVEGHYEGVDGEARRSIPFGSTLQRSTTLCRCSKCNTGWCSLNCKRYIWRMASASAWQ